MDERARVRVDGALEVGRGIVIVARDLHVRVTTPGGPGGQHANRTMSRVVVTFDVAHAESIDEPTRMRLTERFGRTVSASSSTSRSQLQNRSRATEILAQRIAEALVDLPARRATRPTRSSVTRRLDTKHRRGAIKSDRRRRDDD